jgi:hypothetical protein
MDAIKLFKGLFIHNAETGSQISGSQSQVNVKVSPVVVAGVKSTIGGSEVHAIDAYPDSKGINRLEVENGGFAREGGRQTLINFAESGYAAGATPASKQWYTVTAGKTLYVTGIINTNSTGTIQAFVIRDGIADAGALKYYCATPISTTSWFSNVVPIKFTKGLRFDAADQGANSTHSLIIVGWEE